MDNRTALDVMMRLISSADDYGTISVSATDKDADDAARFVADFDRFMFERSKMEDCVTVRNGYYEMDSYLLVDYLNALLDRRIKELK